MPKRSIMFLLFLIIASSSFSLKKEFDFYGLRLGMTQNEIKVAVNANSDLKADESRYLGKINEAIPFTLKAHYHPFINNIFIQFYKAKSYQIIVQLNPKYFDFNNLADTLEDKYGRPKNRTSKVVEWGNKTNDIKLYLEYPTTIKVYDYAQMLKLHIELKENIDKITNDTVLQNAKRAILNEF